MVCKSRGIYLLWVLGYIVGPDYSGSPLATPWFKQTTQCSERGGVPSATYCWDGFPRGCQCRTTRLRKALGETFPTPAFFGTDTMPIVWRYRAWKIGPGGCGACRLINLIIMWGKIADRSDDYSNGWCVSELQCKDSQSELQCKDSQAGAWVKSKHDMYLIRGSVGA